LDALESQEDHHPLAIQTEKPSTPKTSLLQNINSSYQLIRGKNILHTQQLLFGGHIDFAFLAYPQRHHKSMKNYLFCAINPDLYPALTQSMVIIKQATRSVETTEIANEFVRFLRSETAQTYLQKIGYLAILHNPLND